MNNIVIGLFVLYAMCSIIAGCLTFMYYSDNYYWSYKEMICYSIRNIFSKRNALGKCLLVLISPVLVPTALIGSIIYGLQQIGYFIYRICTKKE